MDKKIKKICFVCFFSYSLFHPKTNVIFGGAEVQMYNFAKYFSKYKKYKIIFLLGRFNSNDKIKDQDNVELRYSLKVSWGPTLRKLFSPLFILIFFIELIKINADVYIQRDAGVETGIISFYCKLFKKNFVFMTAHEWDCNGFFIQKNKFKGQIFKFGLKNSRLIITQTKDQKKMLKNNL